MQSGDKLIIRYKGKEVEGMFSRKARTFDGIVLRAKNKERGRLFEYIHLKDIEKIRFKRNNTTFKTKHLCTTK